MAGWTLPLAAITLAHAAAYSPNSPFDEGEVCEGVDVTAPVGSILRGKHLLLGGMDWPPLLYPDASRHRGWGGVDIELLDRMGEMLGFNYSIHDISYPAEGATWMTHFLSEIRNSDALITYWAELAERIESGSIFIRGHVDLSLVLLSRTSNEGHDPWAKSLYSWSLPFDTYLWFSVVAIVVASAAVDFLVEKRDGATTYSQKLYEFTAGVLWGGYGEPRSTCSSIYQVMISFFMLIIISSYTANLAAFMLLSATPSSAIQGMDHAVLEESAVCANMKSLWAIRLKATFPRARWIDTSSYAEGEPKLLDECLGLVVPKTEWRTMQMHPEWCHLHLVEVVSEAESTGWATNSKSGCVVRAFSWAMTSLIESGQVDVVLSDYYRAASCSSSEISAGSRRMAEAPLQDEALPWTGPGWASAAGRLAARSRTQTAVRTRRMKGLAKAGEPDSPDDDATQQVALTKQMTVSSFAGLFTVWGLLSVASVAWTYVVPDSWKRMPHTPKACSRCLQLKGESSDATQDGLDSLSVQQRMAVIWSNSEEILSILRRPEQVCAASVAQTTSVAADGIGDSNA